MGYLKRSRLACGPIDLVLVSYNAGQSNNLKITVVGFRPLPETQTYVRRVKGYLAPYRQRARSTRYALLDESLRRNALQRYARGTRDVEAAARICWAVKWGL